MQRTGAPAVNVAGQSLVATVVAKRQSTLETKPYNGARTDEPFQDVTERDEQPSSAAHA